HAAQSPNCDARAPQRARGPGAGSCCNTAPGLSPVSIYPVPGLPEISSGAPLAGLIVDGLARLGLSLETDDVVVITQKIVSKAEGRIRSLDEVQPSARA